MPTDGQVDLAGLAGGAGAPSLHHVYPSEPALFLTLRKSVVVSRLERKAWSATEHMQDKSLGVAEASNVCLKAARSAGEKRQVVNDS